MTIDSQQQAKDILEALGHSSGARSGPRPAFPVLPENATPQQQAAHAVEIQVHLKRVVLPSPASSWTALERRAVAQSCLDWVKRGRVD
jgi:hypothetical protein